MQLSAVQCNEVESDCGSHNAVVISGYRSPDYKSIAVFHNPALHCTMHCTTLPRTTLHCTALHCIVLS